MTLTWQDDVTDCTSTREDGPISDVWSLLSFVSILYRMEAGQTKRMALRVEGKVIGFEITDHGEMGEAP